jgi:hypothetical protein
MTEIPTLAIELLPLAIDQDTGLYNPDCLQVRVTAFFERYLK